MSLVVLSYPACTGVIWSSVSSRWVCTLMLEERIVWWVDATMLLYIFLSIVSLSGNCCHQFEKDSFLPSFFPHSGPSDSVHEAEKMGQKNTLLLQTVCMQGNCPDATRARSQRQRQQRARREASVCECMCVTWGFQQANRCMTCLPAYIFSMSMS